MFLILLILYCAKIYASLDTYTLTDRMGTEGGGEGTTCTPPLPCNVYACYLGTKMSFDLITLIHVPHRPDRSPQCVTLQPLEV